MSQTSEEKGFVPIMATDVKTDDKTTPKEDCLVQEGQVTTASSEEIPYTDPTMAMAEKRVLRKLDMHLAPLFCALYFMSYLDRSNIGNAAVAGLTDQLGLSSAQFSTAVSVFFATYVGFIVPLVLALRRFKPHRSITIMAGAWALVTIGTAFVKSYSALVALRLLLGICESGFFPCISLYITMFYDRREQGLRFAYLFSAIALSGMFGGLVATGITSGVGTKAGLRPWSWLYIVEGTVSLLVVPWAWFGLPESPTSAKWWITAEEKDAVERREQRRREYMGQKAFDWAQVRSALRDWRLYVGALVQFFQNIVMYGFSTFLPSILKNDLGYSSLEAQYLSVPVYFLGGVSFFTWANIGDKRGVRGSILGCLDVFAVAGYAILLAVENSHVRYMACFLIAIPLYCGPGLNEMWITNNTAPHYRRATSLGISQAVGNAAGVVAPQIYRQIPYRLGHWGSLVSAIISMVLIAVQVIYFRMQNRKKVQILSGERPDDRTDTTGENNLDFKYVY